MKFNHLNVPTHWQNYWTRYPEGHTILEALISWVSQVDSMVDNANSWNEYLDNFVVTFDKELQNTVTDTLSDWQDSGFLDVVVSEALQWELDNYKTTNEQDKASLSTQLQQKQNAMIVNIKDFGGNDNGTVDNLPAFRAAKLKAGNGGTIVFPGNKDSVYFFSILTNAETDGVNIKSDEGVKISIPGNFAYGQKVNLLNDVGVVIRAIDTTRKTPADFIKKHFLSKNDRDKSERYIIDTSQFSGKFLTYGSTPIATGAVTVIDDNNVSIVQGAGSLVNSIVADLSVGEALTANAKGLTNASSIVGIVVVTATKYYYSYIDQTGKVIVGHTIDGTFKNVSQDFALGYQSYTLSNGVFAIERLSDNSFIGYINGVCMTNGSVDMGEPILGIGLGAFNSPLTITNFIGEKNAEPGAMSPVKIGFWGDSLTADVYGNWEKTFRETLEGSMGCHVRSITNRAVGGATSAQQLLNMQNEGVGGVNYAIIQVGTNDIQTQVPVATYIANVSAMVDLAKSAGVRVILGVPPLYYSNTFSAGKGANTSNYEKGALHRGALIRYAAENKIKTVDIQKVFGMTTAEFDVLYDNIHPNYLASELMGVAYAKAVVGDYYHY